MARGARRVQGNALFRGCRCVTSATGCGGDELIVHRGRSGGGGAVNYGTCAGSGMAIVTVDRGADPASANGCYDS